MPIQTLQNVLTDLGKLGLDLLAVFLDKGNLGLITL